MSYLSLYRKWRPGAFEEVLGQAHVTETLSNALREDKVSHAYLFAGPRGTGKTSTARILAKALNCAQGVSASPCGGCSTCKEIADGTSIDVFEMDAASHTSVDDVREIRERIPFAAAGGGRKVYIIDEAHQLSTAAFNALLKMLEEPPGHVVFVLCTTESHKLPATVVSRCQRFEFRRLSTSELAAHLADIAKREEVSADPQALTLIARHARGSARDALSLLDQASGMAESVTAAVVVDMIGQPPEQLLLDLGAAIARQDVVSLFRIVDGLVDAGWDPRQLLTQILEHLRAVFLALRGADDMVDIDDDHRGHLREQAGEFAGAHLEWALRILGEAQADVRWSGHPRLTLEVSLARAARPHGDDAQALETRIERLERVVLRQAAGAAPATAPPEPEPRAPASAPPEPEPRAPASVKEPSAPVPAPEPKAKPAAAKQGAAKQTAKDADPAKHQPAPPAAAAPSGSQDAWESLLETVRAQSRVTHTHLKEAWLVEANDHEVVLGFDKEFHAGEIAKPKHTGLLTTALQQVFGRKLRLRCEVMTDRPGSQGGGDAAPQRDPVDLMVKGLGAEIVEEVDS